MANGMRVGKWVIVGIALTAVIAAAFVGGRLIAGQWIIPAANRELHVEPSSLLPQGEAINGLYVDRVDNALRIGTGNVEVHAVFDVNGKPTGEFNSRYDGPVVEIILAPDTKLYRDDTDIPPIPSDTVSSAPIQQVVTRIDALDDLTPHTTITVWGKRSGDRVDADVVLVQIH